MCLPSRAAASWGMSRICTLNASSAPSSSAANAAATASTGTSVTAAGFSATDSDMAPVKENAEPSVLNAKCKAPAETYVEEPFPYKVREKDAIQRHLDADDRMNKIDMKIKYYDTMLKFLEEIIRAVSNRTYQIKNAIEWNKFQAGYN